MSERSVIVRLKGGLGNQMFQYAAGLALALRNGANLKLDTVSGFARDSVGYRRFSLGEFPIRAGMVGLWKQLPFWFERIWNRNHRDNSCPIRERPWGDFISECRNNFHADVANCQITRNTWMEGYWQSEDYFADCKDIIAQDFALPAPHEFNFVEMANMIDSCNSVAVGARLFEEVPGNDKAGVGGLTPFSFYEDAANRLTNMAHDLTFFVFCTTVAPIRDKFNLPGKVYYITHDNGYAGAIQRLWLLSRCRHHVLSNSSFYWWGAWLAERKNPGNTIIAYDSFPNPDTIPSRWIRFNAMPHSS